MEDAAAAVDSYLNRLGNTELVIDEIMVFDNNAYASIVDRKTKSGAFEVLVDPTTKAVFLEYGPAMMWNTDYGMMGGRGFGMMGSGGMMGPGGSYGAPGGQAGQASVTAEQALQIAQDYLDQYQPGVTVSDHANVFPGYYTVDTEKDGTTLGMLSVNAYTGQVWVHTWHGKFVEEREMMEEKIQLRGCPKRGSPGALESGERQARRRPPVLRGGLFFFAQILEQCFIAALRNSHLMQQSFVDG